MVNLYFLQENDEWIHALAIPLVDIQRLSLRPLKWLRFVSFTILGVKGHLCDAPPGPVVDYNIIPPNDDASYYFLPDTRSYSLIDYQALNDQLTSEASTSRRADFRTKVAERDGNRCVISLSSAICDAAHIIPHAKGNAYIDFVITQRRSLYDWHSANEIDIDMTENGMFVKKDIHGLFGLGMCGFLKTPNFALRPDDIPIAGPAQPGEIPASRVTLQHIQLGDALPSHTIPQTDVQADWFGQEDAPPSLILDFMYGVAVIKHWGTPDALNLLDARHEDFAHLPPIVRLSTYEDDEDNGDDGTQVDDPNDSDYCDEHKRPAKRKGRREIRHQSKDSELCQAMDVALELSMVIRGYPPGTTVAGILQKQREEAEIRSRQIAREKVEGWLEGSPAMMAED